MRHTERANKPRLPMWLQTVRNGGYGVRAWLQLVTFAVITGIVLGLPAWPIVVSVALMTPVYAMVALILRHAYWNA